MSAEGASGSAPLPISNLGGSVGGVGGGSHDGSLKGKSAKPSTRWSGLFGSTYKVRARHFPPPSCDYECVIYAQDNKMDLLAEQLNEYSRHGIPRLPHLLSFQADEDTEEALYRYAVLPRHILAPT